LKLTIKIKWKALRWILAFGMGPGTVCTGHRV
jgi:hypothetical protein